MSDNNKPSNLIIPENKLYIPNDSYNKIQEDQKIINYKNNRRNLISSTKPNIELLHNNVLVRAVPPYIKSIENNIIVNKLVMSEELSMIYEDLSFPVNDVQEILLIGSYVENNESKIKPGKFAKIDFNRFKTIKPGKNLAHTDVIYNVPIVEIQGKLFMLIDARDISYVMEKKYVDEMFYTQD